MRRRDLATGPQTRAGAPSRCRRRDREAKVLEAGGIGWGPRCLLLQPCARPAPPPTRQAAAASREQSRTIACAVSTQDKGGGKGSASGGGKGRLAFRTLRQRIRERQSLVRTCCRQIWSCARTMNTQLIVSRYTACNVKKRWFVSCCLRPVPRKASLPTVGATSWILKIPHGMRTLQNKSFQAKQARTTYDARGSSWSSSSGGVTREECSES